MLPETFYKCGDDVVWIYNDWQIAICEGEWQDTLEHEYWHLVEDKYLTQEQREQYKALYDKHKKIGRRAFQNDYAFTEWQEWFAEDYSSYKMWERVNIYTKKRIKLISSFLN